MLPWRCWAIAGPYYIVRDMMIRGLQTYKEFLASDERIATNILADRLRKLEGHGIITTQPDAADGRKLTYSLTPKGIDLAPVLAEMVLCGRPPRRDRQSSTGPRVANEQAGRRIRSARALGSKEKFTERANEVPLQVHKARRVSEVASACAHGSKSSKRWQLAAQVLPILYLRINKDAPVAQLDRASAF
jgi:DNA-binding HxlR family transcriptional regulator